MLNRTRSALLSPAVINRHISHLYSVHSLDRSSWNALLNVDWSREDLPLQRKKASELAVETLKANSVSYAGDNRKLAIGQSLELLQAMPTGTLRAYLTRNRGSDDAATILEAVNRSLGEVEQYFPGDGKNSTAFYVALGIASRIFDGSSSSLLSESAKALAVGIAHKVWSWGGSPEWKDQYHSLLPNEDSRSTVSYLRLLARDALTKAYLAAQFFDGDGDRTRTSIAWLEVRLSMAAESGKTPLRVICDLCAVIALFAESCEEAALMMAQGGIPEMGVKILCAVPDPSSEYLHAAANFLHAMTASPCMDILEDSSFVSLSRVLLSAGILSILKDVLLYADPKREEVNHERAWKLMRFLVGKLMIRRFVPYMAKALSRISHRDLKKADPEQMKEWLWTVGTVNIFVKAHDEHASRQSVGFCDNTKCNTVPLEIFKCGGCRRASYCSVSCQAQDWGSGHKAECQMYKSRLFPQNRAHTDKRVYMMHVLKHLLLQAVVETERSQEQESEKEDGEVVKSSGDEEDCSFFIFNIGPRNSNKDSIPTSRLESFADSIEAPHLFLWMLETAKRKGFEIAGLAVADPPRERFFLVGLFEESKNDDERRYEPVKAMEISGLDRVINSQGE